jgi:TPR repeat protein
VHLGDLALLGVGVPRDPARARALFEVACAEEPGAWCARLAEAYRAGEGGPVDAEKAAALRALACADGDAPSCAQ